MKTQTETILTIMKVLTWIVFIGLCIKTGSLIISFFVSLFVDPAASVDMYMGLNLYYLYEYSEWQYICMASLIIFLSGLKAWFFFLVTRIFSKINLIRIFSPHLSALLIKISCTAFGIGILVLISKSYYISLFRKGVEMPSPIKLYFDGASEFLFMAGIIFIIAQVFKRGLEIQSENELTI